MSVKYLENWLSGRIPQTWRVRRVILPNGWVEGYHKHEGWEGSFFQTVEWKDTTNMKGEKGHSSKRLSGRIPQTWRVRRVILPNSWVGGYHKHEGWGVSFFQTVEWKDTTNMKGEKGHSSKQLSGRIPQTWRVRRIIFPNQQARYIIQISPWRLCLVLFLTVHYFQIHLVGYCSKY